MSSLPMSTGNTEYDRAMMLRFNEQEQRRLQVQNLFGDTSLSEEDRNNIINQIQSQPLPEDPDRSLLTPEQFDLYKSIYSKKPMTYSGQTPQGIMGGSGVRDDGMSANDLQRQLNRGTVAADNVADTEASITSLENERFTQPQPQPQPSGILASNRLAPSGPYGGSGLDPNIKKQRELEFLNQIYTQKNPNISGGLGGSNPSGMGGMGMGGFNFPVQATPTYQGGGFGPNVNNYSGAVSGVQSGYGTPQPAYGAASTLSNVQTPQTPYAGLNTANYTGYTNPAVQSTYAAQSPYGG